MQVCALQPSEISWIALARAFFVNSASRRSASAARRSASRRAFASESARRASALARLDSASARLDSALSRSCVVGMRCLPSASRASRSLAFHLGRSRKSSSPARSHGPDPLLRTPGGKRPPPSAGRASTPLDAGVSSRLWRRRPAIRSSPATRVVLGRRWYFTLREIRDDLDSKTRWRDAGFPRLPGTGERRRGRMVQQVEIRRDLNLRVILDPLKKRVAPDVDVPAPLPGQRLADVQQQSLRSALFRRMSPLL
jgi:hypothetical protein